MPRVFISYVRENKDVVQRLAEALSAHGVEVWLDRTHLKPGARWKDAIRDAIAQGDFFIACFSAAYNSRSKTYMNEELTLAIEELRQRPTDRAWFIPVLLSACAVPDRSIGAGETLRSIQWVPLHENWEEGLRLILAVIQPIAALIRKLEDPSELVRIRAAEDLGEIGPPAREAIPLLIRALQASNDTVRVAAAYALGKIGDASWEVISALLRIKQGGWKSSRVASAVLVAFGTLAVPALIQALRDQELYVRRGALETLHELGESAKDAVPALEEASRDEEFYIRANATMILNRIQIDDMPSSPPLREHAAVLQSLRKTSWAQHILKSVGVRSYGLSNVPKIGILGMPLPETLPPEQTTLLGDYAPGQLEESGVAHYTDHLVRVVQLIAPTAHFIFAPLRPIADAAGGYVDSDIIESGRLLASAHPDVLLITLSPTPMAPKFMEMLQEIVPQGIVPVCSYFTGHLPSVVLSNSLRDRLKHDSVMYVSAVDRSGLPFEFQLRNKEEPVNNILFRAPGENIPVVIRKTLRIVPRSDAHFATAIAAGIAARVSTHTPHSTPEERIALLRATSAPMGKSGGLPILQLHKALAAARVHSQQEQKDS